MDVLPAVGLLLSLLSIASPVHKKVRQIARPSLINVTIKQLPYVAAAQVYTSKFLDVAVLLSAATITLEVYLTLIPVLIWSGKEREVVAGLLPQLALAGYVVFAIKDLLESPRPGDCLKAAPDAGITVRDPSGDIEDGVPSAHCCGAVSLLYYGIHAASAAGLLPDQHKALAQGAAAVWVVWLAWGRAYLGLHSPLDLASGTFLGWALLRLWLLLEQPYVSWLQTTAQQQPWQLVLAVLLVSAVLMRCYPMPSRWTSCYNYATAWAAGWAGCTLGWCLLQQLQLVGYTADTPGHSDWMFGGLVPPLACKVFLGLGLVAATKVVVKAVLLALYQPLFACVPHLVRCLWQPPIVGAAKQLPAQPLQQQQQQPQRLAGYASAVLAEGSRDAVASRDTTDKPVKQCAADAGAVLKAEVQSALGPRAGAGSSTVSSSSSSKAAPGLWSLRCTPEGVGNDVVATARWCSYFAVGFTVSMWQWIWPQLHHRLSPVVAAT